MQTSTSSNSQFSQFNLIEPIQKALESIGYSEATEIQQQAIPELLKGRDLLGCAQTGTGKTAAFALPILNSLAQLNQRPQPKMPRALILTPTRELAVQIQENFKKYGRFLRLKSTTVFGGVSQGAQVRSLAQGVDIVIATPGRLLDLIEQKFIFLNQLEVFVLDEADRMLDMGFVHDIQKIIKMLPRLRQNLLFSATMPNGAKKIADELLVNPVYIDIAPDEKTSVDVEHSLFAVLKKDKKSLLLNQLRKPQFEKVIIFTQMKHVANQICEHLLKAGLSAEAIHGNKSQNARQKALNRFRAGEVKFLVATDVAARGIDVSDISHVINYDIPNVAENYVHRIGRTGRAGAKGIAYSFCDIEDVDLIRDIERAIDQRITILNTQPYHSEMIEKVLNKPVSKHYRQHPKKFSGHPSRRSRSPKNFKRH